jgi:holo-[acyl-carrier protein] synthase
MRARTDPPRVRTGCDLQRIEDVEDAIRSFGDRYLDRVYTPVEQRAGQVGGAASLAARFAAKEAVLKLIGTADGVDLRSVEIAQEAGRPVVRLTDRASDLAEAVGLGPVDVSLSHSGDHAMAVAVAVVATTADPHHEEPTEEHRGPTA